MKNSKKIIIFFLLAFSYAITLKAQTTYKIEKFSNLIYVTVTVANKSLNEVFKQGTIQIFDSKTKKNIINIKSHRLNA